VKRAAGAALVFLAIASSACQAQVSVEGALFFDRGHYWIELAFRDAAGRDTIPRSMAPAQFEITKLDGADRRFRPSKVEVGSGGHGGPVVILSSGKLEGRSCYRVIYLAPSSDHVVVDSVCDPFLVPPAGGECGGAAFFRKYVAVAFRKDGDAVDLNQFKYEYDFSDEKATSSFVLEPRFRTHGFSIEPLLEQSTVAYSLTGRGKTSARKLASALTVSKAVWVNELGLILSTKYRYDRSAFDLAAGDSAVAARSLAVEGRIRLDNLFDRLNRHCVSVFKGIDVGCGYAWYQPGGGDHRGASGFSRSSPFAGLRATWTILDGFQLSYSLQSFWPGSTGDEFAAFQSVRFRLLLRGALPAQEGKAYHPDVVFAYDSGRRLPLFAKEEKISIGFSFDLYPW
jgi:hypothetical protein